MFYFGWQFDIWIFKRMPQIYHLYNYIFRTENVLESISKGKYVFREAHIYLSYPIKPGIQCLMCSSLCWSNSGAHSVFVTRYLRTNTFLSQMTLVHQSPQYILISSVTLRCQGSGRRESQSDHEARDIFWKQQSIRNILRHGKGNSRDQIWIWE